MYVDQVGPCSGHFRRWHYDPSTDECREFFYRGCFGNGNNFATKWECQKKCSMEFKDRPFGALKSYNLISEGYEEERPRARQL